MTGDAPDSVVAGRYRLVRQLRTGGTGTVWEATDERLNRPVALTMFRPESGPSDDHAAVVGLAMRDARHAATFEHPNAVRVYDVIQHDGEPCLVTELVAAQRLSDILTERRTLPEHEVATLGAQVASALATAHAAGIVHGDVNPADILVAEDGTARITGLGIAHGGTPGYASDVAALGATLYGSLEGAPPSEPVEPPPAAGALGPLLLEMLASDPGARPTMAAVADRLGRLAAEGAAPGAPPGTARPGRRRWVVVAAIVVVVALVVAGVLVLRDRAANQPSTAPQPSPSPTTSTSASPSTTATPTTSPAPSTPSTGQGAPTAEELAAVVSRYYSLVPGNPDEAFALLTPDYQTRVAGGRQAFQRFWAGYSAVAATDVTGSPPSTVTATVTYTTKAGQVTRERTTFGLVEDGGVLKIGSSTVTGRS